MSNIFTYIPLVAFTSCIALSAYIYNRKPRTNLGTTFSIQIFVMSLVCFLNFIFLAADTLEEAMLWGKILLAVDTFIPAMWLRLILIFTSKGTSTKKTLWVYLPVLPFALLGLTTDLIIKNTHVTFWGYGLTPGSLYAVWIVSMAIVFFSSFYLLYRFYRKAQAGREKSQVKIFALGMAIPVILALLAELFVPQITSNTMSMLALPILIYVATTTYAVLKYGLITVTSKMAADKIVETIASYLVVIDSDKNIALVNTLTAKLLGQKKEEFIGKPLNSLPIKTEELIAKLEEKEMIEGYETELLEANKDPIPLSVNASKIKGSFGDTVGFIFAMRDISSTKELVKSLNEKMEEVKKSNAEMEDNSKAMLNLLEDAKKLEEELKTEKAGVERKVEERTRELNEEHVKLQSSINSLNMGFFMVDMDSEIIMINPIAKRILCFSGKDSRSTAIVDKDMQAECKMKDIQETLHGIFDFQAELKKSIAEKRPIDIKSVELNNRFLHILISPIVEVEESKIKVIGAVALIEDVTEARALERARDEFFSIASHELRTPLTAIRGNTSLIEQMYIDKIEDKDFKEMIDDIHESSQRLIEIVNDFLNMSRLELGKIQFNNQPVDLIQVIEAVIKEYQTTGSIKMLYLKFNHPEGEVKKVFADKDRVKEVLINLIGNAIKFTQKGGITLDLTVEDEAIKVTVADTGEGISEEGQDRLFKKFQQAAGNIYTRDSTRGTGLGLYISKLMMEGMKGHIGLEKTEIGKGTTFYFTLPIATEEQLKNSEQATAATPVTPMTKTKLRMSQGKE